MCILPADFSCRATKVVFESVSDVSSTSRMPKCTDYSIYALINAMVMQIYNCLVM